MLNIITNLACNNTKDEDRDLQYYTSLLGHGFVLHSSISLGCPVQVPPFASSTDFVLVLDLVPVPHESEHSPNTQSFHSQCIAKCMQILSLLKLSLQSNDIIFLEILFIIILTIIILTRTVLCVAILYHCCVTITSPDFISAIGFFYVLCSGIGPRPTRACYGAFANLPVIPFTINSRN